jgi:chromosome segregation ATPase
MSIKDLRNQIGHLEEQISIIRENISEKKVSNINEIQEEYDSIINEKEKKFQENVEILNEISNKVADLFTKRKQVKLLLNSISKEITSLSKKKTKALRRELKNIDQEGIDKIKEINRKVKILKNKFKIFKANALKEKRR